MQRPSLGATHYRSSLGAGMMIKQKWKWGAAVWSHSQQILFGSWNDDKTEVAMRGNDLDPLELK